MHLVVHAEPTDASLPAVDYRWDADTEILTARVRAKGVSEGLDGSVELEGGDGWLTLDVTKGRITAVEVAVWPEVRTVAGLVAPDAIAATATIPARASQPGIAALEVEAKGLSAETDPSERTIHFRVGTLRHERHVRIAADLILDLDGHGRVSGLWLLNVPPFPES